MDWDNLYSSFKKFANRTADRINHTADIATLQLKLSANEKNVEEAYAALGKIAYEHFTSDEDLSEQVARAVSAVNRAKLNVKQVEAELAEARERRDEAIARARAEREAAAADRARTENAIAPDTEADTEDIEQVAREAGDKMPINYVVPTSATPITAETDGKDTVEISVEEC